MEGLDNLNEVQRQEILRKRQELLKKMGVNNAGKTMSESVVSTNSANRAMAEKLAAIRGGSAKAELNKFITATSKGGGGVTGMAGFNAIPESKIKKNPNQKKEEVNPEYRQELQNFSSSQGSSELSAIDNMFGGDGPSRMPSTGEMSHAPVNTELSIDSMVMPAFNPQLAIQQKMRTQQNNTQAQAQSPYLKFAGESAPIPTNEQFVDINPIANQNMTNMAAMQMMMETIAKGIAEKTIRSVLNEYSQQQKGKLQFEFYNKEKTIIKTSEGKYYRITQVELKKK